MIVNFRGWTFLDLQAAQYADGPSARAFWYRAVLMNGKLICLRAYPKLTWDNWLGTK